MRDRNTVSSPDEARRDIALLEARIANIKAQRRWIEQAMPPYAYEALIGVPRWQQLEGAKGRWGRVPDERRAGEVSSQIRESRRLEDEERMAQAALKEAHERAAGYDPEHQRYDTFRQTCLQLEARVVRRWLPRLLDPAEPPSAAEIDEYNTVAAELQDLAGELLRLSGFRPEWGTLSETNPADRFSRSMHARVLDRLPPRPRGPWAWQQKTELAEVTR